MSLRPLLLLMTALAASPAAAKTRSASKAASYKPAFPTLDRAAESFASKASAITNAAECFPIQVQDEGRIGIHFLHCTDQALARDGAGVRISENFSVPEGIARRYNFWRRIYSMWDKDQYVMHLSEYPEVVVSAFDGRRLPEGFGPIARENAIKRVAKGQREQFRQLFLAMHRLRKDETKFTPAMRRLARQMAHIPSQDKYLIASRSMRLQRGQRDFIATGLSVAPKYLPAIEQEFLAQGIPVEISRLAFVESSFNLRAVSKVGASGVYQIMPATGRQYLKMHSGVDERNDPIKASQAACKLLKMNYRMTGSWPLAITAYNHGVGGIRRAMSKVGSKDIVQLINRYDGNAFGFASKNFYASFLGVLATLKEADRLFPDITKPAALAFDTIRVPRAMTLATLHKQHRFDIRKVADLNPDLSRPLVRSQAPLPAGYVLKIPAKSPRDIEKYSTATSRRAPNS
jgi:membrane-bound lytic murein transglycosylase D